MTTATFEQAFGVNTLVDTTKALVTVTKAQRRGSNYLIRLRLHPNNDLNAGWQTASQEVPAVAFDEASVAVLEQFIIDSASFVRRTSGALASRAEGGNSYSLRVIAGLVRVNEMERRTNPTTGEVSDFPGSFSHGILSLAPMGQPPKAVAFDPTLGAPAPAKRRLSAKA